MNLLIVGAPGVGKGTMSRFLVAHYKLVHVSTGDMLRQAIADKTPVGLKAKEFMDKGQLVPDEVIHNIIVDRLSQNDIKRGFLFDGYPRTVNQAIDLANILKELNMKIDAVLNLQVDDEVVIKRITGRRTCNSCGSIYNIYYNAPLKEGICDNCGEPLSIRSDDNLESLQIRLAEFHKNTSPVIDYYAKENIVHNINADQDREEEFKDIQKVLEGLK